MKLNLGCGDRYVNGWVNVDHAGSPHRKDQEVDLVDGWFPWQPGIVTHVYAGHLLEHLHLDDAANLLGLLRPFMAPDGKIMIVGPDVDKARKMIDDGTFDFSWGHTLESITHGGHRWPGDEHKWQSRVGVVLDMLEVMGWQDIVDVGIEHVPDEWPVADRSPLWQFAVSASVGV